MPIESTIPIASTGTARRFAARLALFYGTLFGLGGTYLPFFPVWLKAVGIDASWIGIITAVPSVTRFTILPVVTGVSERHQSVRGAMIVTAFVTALGFSVVGTQHQPLPVFLAFAVTACVWTPMVPLTDAYALARRGAVWPRLWAAAVVGLGSFHRRRIGLRAAGRFHRGPAPDLGHCRGGRARRRRQPRASAAGPSEDSPGGGRRRERLAA